MNQTAFSTRLTDQGLIRASGADAASFLHNLLTNDVNHLAEGQARHAGLCTPKGRLVASFLIWKEKGELGNDYLLMLSADILPGVLKKLSMYVLRSKVTLEDISAARSLIGVVEAPSVDSPMTTTALEGGTAIRLDANRRVLAIPLERIATVEAALPAAGSLDDWHLAEIRAGMPRIVAATQEAFVPQMVNYEIDAVGGVSFQKGCYPGQEIVARTQYLGKIKRRMVRARIETTFPPGTDVFTSEAGDQHCGAIVLSAPSPDGGCECLLVVQSSGAVTGDVHIGIPNGPRAQLLDLPYIS